MNSHKWLYLFFFLKLEPDTYLFSRRRNKRLRNQITQIKAEDGRWLDNMEEIQDGFTTFYQKLCLSQNHMQVSDI